MYIEITNEFNDVFYLPDSIFADISNFNVWQVIHSLFTGKVVISMFEIINILIKIMKKRLDN